MQRRASRSDNRTENTGKNPSRDADGEKAACAPRAADNSGGPFRSYSERIKPGVRGASLLAALCGGLELNLLHRLLHRRQRRELKLRTRKRRQVIVEEDGSRHDGA